VNVPRIDASKIDPDGPIFGWDEQNEVVYLRCPFGHIGDLGNHQVSIDGTVSPSVVCPKKGCTFHETVFLEGYQK
jgi:hypothetical protein